MNKDGEDPISTNTVFFLSATVFREKKKKERKKRPKTNFKMALRTICTFALRSGTDFGVNNARTFVTTGTAMTFSIFLKCLQEIQLLHLYV